jgi:dipeptidyl aminopeptidase/acylaminoacyl peptidase
VTIFKVSPDGRGIIYDGPDNSLFLRELASTRVRRLPHIQYSDVSWNTDGKSLFATAEDGQLYSLHAESASWSPITHEPGTDFTSPSCAPSGNRIAVVNWKHSANQGSTFGRLRILNYGGKNTASAPGEWSQVQWSPCGDSIAGIYRPSPASPEVLAVWNSSNRKLRIVPGSRNVEQFGWLYEGRNICMITASASKHNPALSGLYLWDFKSHRPTLLTKNILGNPSSQFSIKSVLYTAWRGGHRPEVWEMNWRTGKKRQLAPWGSAAQYCCLD